MFEDGIDAASARALMQRRFQFGELLGVARGDDLDVSFFGVPDPSAQTDLGGFAMDEPPEANSLHAAFDEEMLNHFPLLNPIDVGAVDEAVANLLSTQSHSRCLLHLAEPASKLAYERILGRKDHDGRQTIDEFAP